MRKLMYLFILFLIVACSNNQDDGWYEISSRNIEWVKERATTNEGLDKILVNKDDEYYAFFYNKAAYSSDSAFNLKNKSWEVSVTDVANCTKICKENQNLSSMKGRLDCQKEEFFDSKKRCMSYLQEIYCMCVNGVFHKTEKELVP